MINQIRGKFTAIFDYRTLLRKKKELKSLAFSLKSSDIHGFFLLFRNLFKIDQNVMYWSLGHWSLGASFFFFSIIGSFLDIRV